MPKKALTARDKAYAFVVEQIVSGDFRGGEFLEEERVSAAVGVSRTPVREAFNRLESERFIELVPRRGARVREVTAQEMLQLYETRRLVEGFAAERMCAMKVGAPAEMVALQETMERLERSDLRSHVECDRAFHRALMAGSKNLILVEVCDALRALQHQVAYAAVRADPSRLDIILDEHSALIKALDKGDADRAVRILTQHLQPIAQVLATLR
ncbi:MAG: GntR family transcriptional regulator [Pseudomonadota bacterium]